MKKGSVGQENQKLSRYLTSDPSIFLAESSKNEDIVLKVTVEVKVGRQVLLQRLLELNRAAFPIANDRRRSNDDDVVKLRAAHFEIIMGFTTEVRKLRNRPSPRF